MLPVHGKRQSFRFFVIGYWCWIVNPKRRLERQWARTANPGLAYPQSSATITEPRHWLIVVGRNTCLSDEFLRRSQGHDSEPLPSRELECFMVGDFLISRSS